VTLFDFECLLEIIQDKIDNQEGNFDFKNPKTRCVLVVCSHLGQPVRNYRF